jgi:N utilization substance protein A
MTNKDADFIHRLFIEEIPEVASGAVEIKAIARMVGYRCKIAVCSHDPAVDCIGVCVGERGSRIKKIVDQLGGERIDLIRWDESLEKLICNSLQPAQIQSIELHPHRHQATVFVAEDQLALAVGRRAMNRELASRICGWEIEIVSEPKA